MILESGFTYITERNTTHLEALGQQGVRDLSLWVAGGLWSGENRIARGTSSKIHLGL